MPVPLLYVLLAMTLVTFAAFGRDKRRAVRGMRRTSEGTLLWLSLLGGCIGGWIGMQVFRHKTRKRSFQIKMVLVTLVDATVLWFWLLR